MTLNTPDHNDSWYFKNMYYYVDYVVVYSQAAFSLSLISLYMDIKENVWSFVDWKKVKLSTKIL